MAPKLKFPLSIALKFLILLTFSSLKTTSGRFIIYDHNVYDITTEIFNYPEQEEELDVIWRYDHSIHLNISEFELDGQSGDFFLVSDLPLTENDGSFHNDTTTPWFLPKSIVTSQGLLMSWKITNETDIQVLSKHGCFLYFHAENTATRGTFPFKGFKITVENLDDMRTPPPTTTTEPTLPEETVPLYITKFLSCNPPEEFLKTKDEFKTALAQVATEYCKETSGCGEFLSGDILGSEVNIPTEGGIHYCDPMWEVFETCVEVKFAITREEGENDEVYLMPAGLLEDMWAKKGEQLEAMGYCPFVPPPVPKNLRTWQWMASMLGIMFLLLIPLCVVWVWNAREYRHPADLSTEKLEVKEDETDTAAVDRQFFDRRNPIYQAFAKMKKGSEADSKYFGYSSDTTGTLTGRDNAERAQSYRPKVTTNVLFQEQDVTFEYDNEAYKREDDEELIYGHGHAIQQQQNSSMGRLEIPTNIERGQKNKDNFLTMHRSSYQDGNSDTEI